IWMPTNIHADTPVSAKGKPTPATANTVLDVQQLAARIDQFIAERWATDGIKPAALADDAEYLRRVYLDLAGRIPRAIEVRHGLQAEILAARTTRLFLGVMLQCAQCHDHPREQWTRKQFWEYAAFFSGIRADMNGDFITAVRENSESRSLKIPGTERLVLARF